MVTILLVHGSFQGGWIWQPTAAALRAVGHLVYAPTMEGCAERVHALRAGITVSRAAEELAELLRYEDLSDVVLAGTSSGGMVAAKTASLARLYDIDALSVMVPWLVPEMAASFDVLGQDPWPYGFAANRKDYKVFLAYLERQELLASPLAPEDLFAPELLAT